MKKIGLFILGATLLTACHNARHVETHNEEHVHWSYTGEESPDNWSHISEEYKACGGSQQSPIDIVAKKAAHIQNPHTLEVQYSTSEVKIINNGHTEQFNVNAGNSLTFDGKVYDLKQFHLHSLSEHTMNGEHAPLEVHFVNKAEDGTFAVIGILFEEGAESSFFKKFLEKLPKEEGSYNENTTYDIHELLPDARHYYHYKGSFTTPPCTEVVEWIILTEKLTASKAQLEALHHLLHDNYRPVQPLNSRVLEVE